MNIYRCKKLGVQLGRAGPVELDMTLALETLLPADTRHYYHYQVQVLRGNIFFREFCLFCIKICPLTTGRLDNSNVQRGGALDQLDGHPNHFGGAAGYLPFYDRLRGGCHR